MPNGMSGLLRKMVAQAPSFSDGPFTQFAAAVAAETAEMTLSILIS